MLHNLNSGEAKGPAGPAEQDQEFPKIRFTVNNKKISSLQKERFKFNLMNSPQFRQLIQTSRANLKVLFFTTATLYFGPAHNYDTLCLVLLHNGLL